MEDFQGVSRDGIEIVLESLTRKTASRSGRGSLRVFESIEVDKGVRRDVATSHPEGTYGSSFCITNTLCLKAASQKAEANETRRRVEAEKSALDIRASMLAPQLRAVEEGRATLEGLRREGEGLFPGLLKCL